MFLLGRFLFEEDRFFRRLVEFMTSGPIVAIELVGPDAINRWRSMIGPTDSQRAKEQGSHLLRARFGTGENELNWKSIDQMKLFRWNKKCFTWIRFGGKCSTRSVILLWFEIWCEYRML